MTLNNIEKFNSDRRRFVLIVDSSTRNQQFLSSFLHRFEYEPYPVKTVQDAVEIAGVISPVLILTARQLDDGRNAIGLIKAVRAGNPECAAPVIVIVTKKDAAFERDCLNAGALTCLHTPITLENFYRVIQVAIEPVPRMTIRISTSLPASINGSRSNERVRDISENGAYILTDSLYPLNTKLPIRIKLADGVVAADAVVIYAKRSNTGSDDTGMGLHFVRISEQDQQRIRMYIKDEMTKGVAPLRVAAGQ